MAISFTAAPPAPVEGRTYQYYADVQQEFKDNIGQWGKMFSFPLGDDPKAARAKATEKAAMVKSGKGTWIDAIWNVTVSQPAGPDTDYEVWISCESLKSDEQTAIDRAVAKAAVKRLADARKAKKASTGEGVDAPAETGDDAPEDGTTVEADAPVDDPSVPDGTDVSDAPVRRRRGTLANA